MWMWCGLVNDFWIFGIFGRQRHTAEIYRRMCEKLLCVGSSGVRKAHLFMIYMQKSLLISIINQRRFKFKLLQKA